MKKIILSLLCFLSLSSLAFAQQPVDPNEDTTTHTGSGAVVNPTDTTTSPGRPPTVAPDNVMTRPTRAGSTDNTQPQQNQDSSFLHIATPDSHGLPGGDANTMIRNVLSNVLNFIALIGVLGLIFAGVQLWISQGKADAIGTAKVNIFNLIIGFVIVLLAWSGVTIVLKYLGF